MGAIVTNNDAPSFIKCLYLNITLMNNYLNVLANRKLPILCQHSARDAIESRKDRKYANLQ